MFFWIHHWALGNLRKGLIATLIHPVFQEETAVNLTENDTTSKINFVLEKNNSSNKSTSNWNSFYVTDGDDTVKDVEDIFESVNKNVKDQDIINFNREYITSPMISYLVIDPNSPESGNMEDNRYSIN